MTLPTFFRASSCAVLLAGALALAASGGIGWLMLAFFSAAVAVSWLIEEKGWELRERNGAALVILALPFFYLEWKYQLGSGVARERATASVLAHVMLFLAAARLLTAKADRDWVFLYLISFFEVLLAAGLSVSARFLGVLALYLLAGLCATISFEIIKARRGMENTGTRLLVAPDTRRARRFGLRGGRAEGSESRRLPVIALLLLAIIFALAVPLFLMAPRAGTSAFARSGGGLTGFVGFSSTVTLGEIGMLQRSDRVVMRVRIEDAQLERERSLRWRGVALDEFTGRGWKRSFTHIFPAPATEQNVFRLGTVDGLHPLTRQTFFVEAIDTPVLFAAPRAVAVQGEFPFVLRDQEGAIETRAHDTERISYRAYSDRSVPDEATLRGDAAPYPNTLGELPFRRYLQLPVTLDPRIASMAREVIARSGARNRYDAARAIESYLPQTYGYTLDLKAGGPDPLADFLFRVREGHCEYFATAMAVMLRTQKIAARVVNGFQMGEYNATADAYTVRQQDAHSWVEVYFPATDSWVAFDPTPAAGRPVRTSTGFMAGLARYTEALELMWIQYVVAYDKQEQRSLAGSMRNGLVSLRKEVELAIANARDAVSGLVARLTGGKNIAGAPRFWIWLIGSLLALAALLILAVRRDWLRRLLPGLRSARSTKKPASVVEFYEQMQRILAMRGITRAESETPLEFARATGLPEVLGITRAYNGVRFGERRLTASEQEQVRRWLRSIEQKSEM